MVKQSRTPREPKRLRRGKAFQAEVFAYFCPPMDGVPTFDRVPPRFLGLAGRPDVVVSEMGDLVAVYEIKASDWDLIKPRNLRRNVWRHQQQLFRYVEYVYERLCEAGGPQPGVCYGMI